MDDSDHEVLTGLIVRWSRFALVHLALGFFRVVTNLVVVSFLKTMAGSKRIILGIVVYSPNFTWSTNLLAIFQAKLVNYKNLV